MMNSTYHTSGHLKHLYFGWLDFLVFLISLCLSVLIGIYFGIWGKKEDTPREYLHGGKKMGTVPVAMSLVISFISGISYMGSTTEVYQYGTLYWLVCVSVVLEGLIFNYFILPVFYELQLTSIYEYLELRFNKTVRIMASILYTVYIILFIPIAMYIPALAFTLVSGVSIHYTAPVISALCIFYTMMGGIKAIVWTDFLQGVIMLASSITIIILGLINLGGLDAVWQRSDEGGRLRIFEMNPSPFVRMSFWSVVIGNTFHYVGTISLNQEIIQKLLTLPTLEKAKISSALFAFGFSVLVSICAFTGLLVFATYYDCDPIKTKAISRPDQLLPYYVMDIAENVPGFPGLFTAGIFSASLSSMSSALNALGATVFEDFIRPWIKRGVSGKTANNIMKCIIVAVGVICVLLVFVVEKLGTVLQLYISLSAVSAGAMTGIFTFGMLYPRANSQGALTGGMCSMLIMGWIIFGTQNAQSTGAIKEPVLPTSVEGCEFNTSISNKNKFQEPNDEPFLLYRISFMYYTLIGMVIVYIIGTIVSLLTQPPDEEKTKPSFFVPLIRKYVLQTRRKHITEDVEVKLMNLNT